MTKPHSNADKIIQLANDITLPVWVKFKCDPNGPWTRYDNDDQFPSFKSVCDWHVGHTPPEEPEVFTFSYTGPAPWRVEPPLGTVYFYFSEIGKIHSQKWGGTGLDRARLVFNNCWRTEADASAFKAAAVGEKK